MDIGYTKENRKSYMVIHQEADETKTAFQRKMLEAVPLKSVLPMKSRIIDGETYNYYDISSRITMRQLFGSRYIDMDDLERLRKDIQSVYSEMDQYLLDSEQILMDPDFIFYNYAADKYLFTYNISEDTARGSASAEKLMEYLLERVSPNDRQASDYIYALYEYSEKVDFRVWKVMEFMLEEENISATGNGHDVSADNIFETLQNPETEFVPENINEHVTESADFFYDSKSEKGQSAAFGSVIMMILGLAGLAACVFICLFMELSSEEAIITYAGIGASSVLMLLGIFLFIRNRRKNIKENNIHDNKTEGNRQEMWNEGNMGSPSMEEFVSNPYGMGAGRRWDLPETDGKERSGLQADVSPIGKNASECTVLFEPDPSEREYKLFAIDKKNKQHFVLDKFPFTIGKLSGYADGLADHPSISRMHARIDLKDNNLYISDLNSTNGTFINGIRLNPNETRMLEAGDEIRLGSLNYCLRC